MSDPPLRYGRHFTREEANATLEGLRPLLQRLRDAKDLLTAVAHLCIPAPDGGLSYSRRMVVVLIDGLRYGAEMQQPPELSIS